MNLSNNEILDISPLEDLSNLSDLNISFNPHRGLFSNKKSYKTY
ncbi:hypothetical protein [Flavobacterium sp. YO12]